MKSIEVIEHPHHRITQRVIHIQAQLMRKKTTYITISFLAIGKLQQQVNSIQL